MNFAPFELQTAQRQLADLRKQAAKHRLARSVKSARRG